MEESHVATLCALSSAHITHAAICQPVCSCHTCMFACLKSQALITVLLTLLAVEQMADFAWKYESSPHGAMVELHIQRANVHAAYADIESCPSMQAAVASQVLWRWEDFGSSEKWVQSLGMTAGLLLPVIGSLHKAVKAQLLALQDSPLVQGNCSCISGEGSHSRHSSHSSITGGEDEEEMVDFYAWADKCTVAEEGGELVLQMPQLNNNSKNLLEIDVSLKNLMAHILYCTGKRTGAHKPRCCVLCASLSILGYERVMGSRDCRRGRVVMCVA